MKSQAAEQFARVIIEMSPYSEEIVFVGGWVHALYLAEANETGAVGTEDIDITIPHELLTHSRPTLLELAHRAGFERDPISEMDGVPPWMVYTNQNGETVPIDFLTEGVPPKPVAIVGQPGLLAQGYAGQNVLLHNTRPMTVGSDIHALLDPPRTIKVPTIGAYVLQKGIASNTRVNDRKRAKDIVYIFEIIRHRRLGSEALAQLPRLREKYPHEHTLCMQALDGVLNASSVLGDICEELLISGRAHGEPREVARNVTAWIRRLIAEG